MVPKVPFRLTEITIDSERETVCRFRSEKKNDTVTTLYEYLVDCFHLLCCERESIQKKFRFDTVEIEKIFPTKDSALSLVPMSPIQM